MKKENGAFRCPLCGCRYRHNWLAWIVGIPIAVSVAIVVFYKFHIGHLSAITGAIVAIIIVWRMGLYRLVEMGREDITVKAVQDHKPEKKESRWAIIFMVLLLAAIAAFFLFAIKGI
ncbi:MAG: hypothetical protein PHW60_03365 [Kiritimatiellae bacterium]|nr:hypothetical protein [Kiritimatiellia bacterium]